MNTQEAQTALHQIHEIFGRHSLVVWLDCGTLLGAVRYGKFIPWDNDIDLGIWIDDLDAIDKKELWRNLNRCEFNIYFLADKLILERKGVPINISLYFKDGDRARRAIYPLDTHLLSKAARVLWWVSHARRQTSDVLLRWPRSIGSFTKRLLVTGYEILPGPLTERIQPMIRSLCKTAGCVDIDWNVPLHYFTTFEQMDFFGDQWSVPMDYKKYLEFRYGLDWRVPRKNFSPALEDGAVKR